MRRRTTSGYKPSRSNTVLDAYQQLGEAIVAQAFTDYYNWQCLVQDGITEHNANLAQRNEIMYGKDASRWLRSEEASFYAGPAIDLDKIFQKVKQKLDERQARKH